MAAGAVLCGVATSFELIVAGRLLIGLGAAMVYIPIMKILAVWFRKYEFATASGILLAVGSIGSLSAATPLARSCPTPSAGSRSSWPWAWSP